MAQRKRKQLTPYQREVHNLKRRIREAKKRGWMFEEVSIPRTAKAVRALRGEALWSKAYGFTEQQFGEFYSAQDVIKSLKAEAARRIQTTRKGKQSKPTIGGIVKRGNMAIMQLERWFSSYTPEEPTPTGAKRRNPRWERVMEAKYNAYNAIKETFEGIKEALTERWYDEGIEMPMWEWVGNQLADRLEATGKILPDLTYAIEYASTEENVWQPANQILAALHGAPMSLSDRKNLNYNLQAYDLTDYTDEDAFPV